MDYEFHSTDQDSILIMQCNSCGHEEKIQVETGEVE